jgi:hypothetical protein
MTDLETPETPVFFNASDEKSHSGLAVAIPVIVAAVTGVAVFAVKKLRRKPDTSTPLTVENFEAPPSE